MTAEKYLEKIENVTMLTAYTNGGKTYYFKDFAKLMEEYHQAKLKILGIADVVVPKGTLPYDPKCDEACKFYCTKGNTKYPECLK